jgi:transposase
MIMDLSEKQWDLIYPLLTKKIDSPAGKGRTGQNIRKIINGILSIFRTSAPWKVICALSDLP